MINKKQLVKDFEETIEKAELKALSKISLKRPLTEKEFSRLKELFLKL